MNNTHTHTHTPQLTPVELDFLTSHSSAALSEFEKVSSSSAAGEKVLAMAGSQIESAQKWEIDELRAQGPHPLITATYYSYVPFQLLCYIIIVLELV